MIMMAITIVHLSVCFAPRGLFYCFLIICVWCLPSQALQLHCSVFAITLQCICNYVAMYLQWLNIANIVHVQLVNSKTSLWAQSQANTTKLRDEGIFSSKNYCLENANIISLSYCGICANRILLYFPLSLSQSVSHRKIENPYIVTYSKQAMHNYFNTTQKSAFSANGHLALFLLYF